MMERHLAEELAQQNKERQAIAAYNAMQYIVLALRQGDALMDGRKGLIAQKSHVKSVLKN